MKLLLLLALVTLSVAQVPWGMDSSSSSEEDISGPFGGVGVGYKTRGLRGLFSGKYGGVREWDNVVDPVESVVGRQWGVPNYGPFVKVGNTVVPRHVLKNIINRQRMSRVFGSDVDDVIYGQGINTPFNSYEDIESQVYGQGVDVPFVHQPWTNTVGRFGDVDQMDVWNSVNPWVSGVGVGGFTPYSSKARLVGLMTRGIGGLGVKTGLSRKLREVCPEVDGGLSYESCISDAHSKHFRCLKNVEDHPRYLPCTHKPIVKKALRDWFVVEHQVQKEMVKCLSTTTVVDQIKERTVGVPVVHKTIVDEVSSEVSNEEELSGVQVGVGYNVQVGVDTKKCFYKLREKVHKCAVVESQCPKFRQCHEHPTIKMLHVKKHVMQTKFVHLLDTCLVGGGVNSVVGRNVFGNVVPQMGVF